MDKSVLDSSMVRSNRSLGDQLRTFYNCILLSEDEERQRDVARQRLTEIIHEALDEKDVQVHLVGSMSCGLASKNSDMDLSVDCGSPGDQKLERERAAKIVTILQRHEGEFIDIDLMQSRNVALVMCKYRQADLRCSLRVDHPEHRRIAVFLVGLTELSEPFKVLTVIAREWALSRQLVRRKGALTGYSICLLVLFFLEQVGIVPCEVVRALAQGQSAQHVSSVLKEWKPAPLRSNKELGDLFYSFINFYSNLSIFANNAICVASGKLKPRPVDMKSFRVCLICPVTGGNAGRCYSRVSEPEEPFFKTALNLKKDHDFFTACFTRNLDGIRKAKLIQQLPAFKQLEEEKKVRPIEELHERVLQTQVGRQKRFTQENRGRPGYDHVRQQFKHQDSDFPHLNWRQSTPKSSRSKQRAVSGPRHVVVYPKDQPKRSLSRNRSESQGGFNKPWNRVVKQKFDDITKPVPQDKAATKTKSRSNTRVDKTPHLEHKNSPTRAKSAPKDKTESVSQDKVESAPVSTLEEDVKPSSSVSAPEEVGKTPVDENKADTWSTVVKGKGKNKKSTHVIKKSPLGSHNPPAKTNQAPVQKPVQPLSYAAAAKSQSC